MAYTANRLGFNYYPDTQHYRQFDLTRWLPEFGALGAGWLVLAAPTTHTIPEYFLCELLAAGINPILRFHLRLGANHHPEELKVLLDSYARWGVRYVTIFDRPNLRQAWPLATWSQSKLPERFLDDFIPLAEKALDSGLIPIFPALEPGGDYWDTTFLRNVCRGLCRRASPQLRQEIVLGAYGWPSNRPLDWGSGGFERWPQARPYLSLPDSQDQRGFRIFEWYSQVAAAEMEKEVPIILLGTGAQIGDCEMAGTPAIDASSHAQRNLEIARLLISGESLPKNLLAGNFWPLCTAEHSPGAQKAWYAPNGNQLPIVAAVKALIAEQPVHETAKASASNGLPIAHYLLLPSYDWGIADWHLEAIRPYVKKHQPTIGFSLEEAALARHITIIGGEQAFSEAILQRLRANGSVVERIAGDGIEIATLLASK